jgi:hypothetical protein
MPRIQGLSKKVGELSARPDALCSMPECEYMWPNLSVAGCRYVRGVIHADDVCDEFASERPRP